MATSTQKGKLDLHAVIDEMETILPNTCQELLGLLKAWANRRQDLVRIKDMMEENQHSMRNVEEKQVECMRLLERRLQVEMVAHDDIPSVMRLKDIRVQVLNLLLELEDSIEPIPVVNTDCAICLRPLVSPMVTSCGHSFCLPCMSGYLASQRREYDERHTALVVSVSVLRMEGDRTAVQLDAVPMVEANETRSVRPPFHPPCPSCREVLSTPPILNYALHSVVKELGEWHDLVVPDPATAEIDNLCPYFKN
ncbi:hypothetical protein VNI00_018737 [Paramarasmius palmivorus]|uniref:RING-type domain-containing protein n=1 Tax=Paramarasmius palmivorus TaxID=297713 RepID=A0AAW0AX09_9AGAR